MRRQPKRNDEIRTIKPENYPFGEDSLERPDSKKGKRKGTTEGIGLF